jgi:lipoprotein-anchoring transpeptidase ErfK/SrfK
VVRVAAAARNAHARVNLSLLAGSQAQLTVRAGNPAVGILRLPGPRPFRPQTLAVTLVARVGGPRPIALTRTVVLVVRPTHVSLVGPGAQWRWAFVARSTVAKARPASSAPVVAAVPRTTSDSVPNLVRVLAETRSGWVQVGVVALPNGRSGWVRRRDLSAYHVVQTRVLIDRARLRLTVVRGGRVVLRAPIAIGTARAPTPRGLFYVRERLTHFNAPFYGPIAFGLNARSPTLTDWPGGGIVGIHGTNRPGLVPGRVSHGCIRLRNADILRLARLLPLGAPIEIR